MKKSYTILLIVAFIIVIAFPIPHSRTKQEPYIDYDNVTKTDLVQTFDCSRSLYDGQTISVNWIDMKDQTKIVINIQSSEDVTVGVLTVRPVLGTALLYTQSKKTHYLSATFSYDSYEISVGNPTVFGTGSDAVMQGSINAYHVYETQVPVTRYRTTYYQEWLPWWMP